MDESAKNIPKYKSGFSNASTKKDFVKTSALRFVPGMTPEQLASLGLKRGSYPTPVNTWPGK